MVLADLRIYYAWKNIKSAYNNNKFKISAPTWKETFDLLDGLYSLSNIQDYFEFIKKLTSSNLCEQDQKHIFFKIKARYRLELLTPEKMRFLGMTKKDADKDKDEGNVPKLDLLKLF